MFQAIGAAEKAGSGVDKIMSGWKSSNRRLPVLLEETSPDKIILKMPMGLFIEDNVKAHLISLFGKKIGSIPNEQLRTLELVCLEEFVSNDRLRYALSLHKLQITEMLRAMCKNGFLRSVGHGRATKYFLPVSNQTSISLNSTSLSANDASSGANSASTGANDASSSIDDVLKHGRKRLPLKEREEHIIRLCAEWHSTEELIVLSGLSYSYLKNNILPKLIQAGRLEKLYPEAKTHPRQKYRSKTSLAEETE